MKRTITKLFMLSAALLLSAATFAQDEITHHWPEVRFTIVNQDGTPTDGLMYHVPGWDAWLRYKQLSDGKNVVNGHVRVQKYENTSGLNYKARLVTRYAISSDNRLKVPELKDNTPLYVKINGEGEPKDIRGLKYKDVFGMETGPDGKTSYDVVIIDEDQGYVSTTYKDADNNQEYFKIPTSMTHTNSKEVYNIDEIGDYAFRQYSRGSSGHNFLRASNIIIPKEITSIGRGAFFMNGSTKTIEFETGCPVENILEFNFQDNTALEEIIFSSNVKKLTGTVLGGCSKLKKISFASENPPTLEPFTWSGVERQVFETTTEAGATVPSKCVIEVPLHSAKKYVDANAKFMEFPMSSKFKMNKEYVSYCSDLPFTFKQYDTANKAWNDGDVKAYYVTFENVNVDEGKVTLTEITEAKKIPSTTSSTDTGYFGVVLNGTAQETYDIFYPNNLISDELQATENCMQGVVKATRMGGENPGDGTPYMAMDTQHYSYYVLTDGKFLSVTEPGTFGAHKAFLMIEGSINVPAGARGLSISLPDETTGITTHKVEGMQNDAFYTLQGIQVQQPSKGIFIKNGKKYIIK